VFALPELWVWKAALRWVGEAGRGRFFRWELLLVLGSVARTLLLLLPKAHGSVASAAGAGVEAVLARWLSRAFGFSLSVDFRDVVKA